MCILLISNIRYPFMLLCAKLIIHRGLLAIIHDAVMVHQRLTVSCTAGCFTSITIRSRVNVGCRDFLDPALFPFLHQALLLCRPHFVQRSS